ncbi:peptidase inhibitor family I36 protein [Streptomyces sp. NBC_00826]|uniref:peptidase inhibitor family I36 protein n=1 Tax=Streptomyces sp. NBC_00826 TaxID=2975845 RepID=UPI002F908116|nr:peptidase inhibitor family I36 protein [Streptomyces sp. NBC_00826]WTB60468.1 peptidase inhibitor family I36 protein [Streptomyces sp. NBC_00826]
MSVPSLLRKAALAAAALALAASPSAVAAPNSKAAEPCYVEHFCLWGRGQHEGPIASYTKGSHNVAEQGLRQGGWSVWNRTSETWCLWYKTGYAGVVAEVVKPGRKVSTTFHPYKSLLPSRDFRCRR